MGRAVLVSPSPWQCLSSAAAPPQSAPGGPVQLGTRRVRPSHRAPSHRLGGSGKPPPKSPTPLPLTDNSGLGPRHCAHVRVYPPARCLRDPRRSGPRQGEQASKARTSKCLLLYALTSYFILVVVVVPTDELTRSSNSLLTLLLSLFYALPLTSYLVVVLLTNELTRPRRSWRRLSTRRAPWWRSGRSRATRCARRCY